MTPARTNATGAELARRIELAMIAIGLVSFVVFPHEIGPDGQMRYETLERFATTGVLWSDKYPITLSMLGLPVWFVGNAFGHAREAVAHLNVILFVIGVGLVARDLRRDTDPRITRSILVLLVFGSMFPKHLTVFYGEVFTSLAVTVGVLWLSRGKHRAGWAAILLGLLNNPGSLVGVMFIGARTAWTTRRWVHLFLPLVGFALTRLECVVVRGWPLATGYEGEAGAKTVMPFSGLPGFSYPLLLGLLAVFLSFGKGLVFFAPGMFAKLPDGAPARLRWVQHTLVWFVLGLVLVYCRWWSWYGGVFWGPRFFLAASVPAAFCLGMHLAMPRARSLLANAALLVAVLLSFWVGVNGLVFDQHGLGLCSENGWALEMMCHFTPDMSVLFHPLVAFDDSVPEKTRIAALFVCLLWMSFGVWMTREIVQDLARATYDTARRILRSRPSG